MEASSLDSMTMEKLLKALNLALRALESSGKESQALSSLSLNLQPPQPPRLPASEASLSPYIVKLSNSNYGNDGIIKVSPVEMPQLTHPHDNSHSGGSTGLLPQWIGQDQKVMFSKDGKCHKCYLDCIEDVGWKVSHRC